MKYSFIIPVYNAEKYLRDCLDSVCSQSNHDWECVCVNDGSKDGSKDILECYRNIDERIKVINQENGGPSKARNVGLSMASGDWIVFLDSDDFVKADYLANFDRLISLDAEADVHACKCIIVNGSGVPFEPHRQLPSLPRRTIEGRILDAVTQDEYRWCLQASCAKIVRRLLLLKWNIVFNERSKMWEDSLFWSECFAFSKKIVIDFTVDGYFYRQVQGSLSRIQKPAEFHREMSAVTECISKGVGCGNAQLKRYSAHIAMSLISLIRVSSFFGDKCEYIKGMVYDKDFKNTILRPILYWGHPAYYRVLSFVLLIMPKFLINLMLRCLISK